MSNFSLTLREHGDQQDRATQTVVKVYPFILEPSTARASVTSDKKFCTVLSLETSRDSEKFYALLQYCPFRDIEENSLRVINLRRKTKLQWGAHHRFNEDTLRQLTLADDDGVAEACNELLLRIRSGTKTHYTDADTQTDLTFVKPAGKCKGKRAK